MKKYWKTCVAVLSLSLVSALAFEAYAKRGGFGGSSSFRSSPKVSFRSAPRPKPAPVIKRTTPTKKVTPVKKHTPKKVVKPQKQKFDKNSRNNIAQKQKVANSRAALAQNKSKFKQRPPVKPVTGAKGSSTPKPVIASNSKYSSWSTSARSSNRSTYIQRRSRYYDDWDRPSYAYNSYSSFGMWDSMALWHMAGTGNYALYYHHMNTPGMIAWRLEADRMARDNAELRAQLRAMDQKTSTMTGARDPNYVPDGVDRDVLLSAEVLEQTKPVLKWCTGELDKNYHAIGRLINSSVQSVNVQLVAPTLGTGHNLQLLDKRSCDGALVQRDGYLVHMNDTNGQSNLDYKRLFSPYREVVHLVCDMSSGVEDLTDLNSKHSVMIGKKGSGSHITWNSLVNENERYSKVKVAEIGGSDAKLALKNGDHDCLLSVSGLNTNFMDTITKSVHGVNGKKLELVEWNDSGLDSVIGPDKKKNVYSKMALSSSTYPSIQIDNKVGLFNVDTNVATVPADLIVNNRWIKENPQAYELLSNELLKLEKRMIKTVSAKK